MVITEHADYYEIKADENKVFYQDGDISEGVCISKNFYSDDTKTEYENKEINRSDAEALASIFLAKIDKEMGMEEQENGGNNN